MMCAGVLQELKSELDLGEVGIGGFDGRKPFHRNPWEWLNSRSRIDDGKKLEG